jgi:hypothetical protein
MRLAVPGKCCSKPLPGACRLIVEPSGGRAVGADGLAVHDLNSFGKADHVGDRMMHDRRIARTQFDLFDPALFREGDRRVEVLHRQFAFGRDFEIYRHLDHHVRLAEGPAWSVFRERRQVFVFAFRRAGVDPGDDGLALFLREPAVVAEFERRSVRVGVPGRHLAFNDRFADGLAPWADFGVGGERHRRDLARTVTVGALVEDDRRDVFGEGHASGLVSVHDQRRRREQGAE